MTSPTEHLGIRVAPALKRKLEAQAELEGRTLSNLVNKILAAAMASQSKRGTKHHA